MPVGIKTEWLEQDLDSIVRTYANQFKDQAGGKILRYEFHIDTYKRTVVFKLYVEPKKEGRRRA